MEVFAKFFIFDEVKRKKREVTKSPKMLTFIQSEFVRLYEPNHPVRFAIETLDSVEEVRIIKEALK